MRKTIDFQPVIINKIEDIMAKEGHKTFTGALFATVSNYHNRLYFNKYKGPDIKIIPEAELTNEEYCESKGGRVGKDNNGNSVCIVNSPDGSMKRYFPLDRIEEFI